MAAAISAAFLSACASGEPEAEATSSAPPAITMQGERLFPESIASDAAGTIYIGSNPGMIFRAEAGSDTAPVWIAPDETNGLATVFGVLADDERGLLWVCSNPRQGEGGAAAIKSFSLADGSLVASYPLAVEGPAMCNDMTVDANGDVYASEMLGGRILKLAKGGEAFEEWGADPELAAIDGIAFSADKSTLYANLIQKNQLIRVERGEDGSFAGFTVLETSQPLDGPDGLRALDGNRMLQSEGNAGIITLLTFPEEGPVQVETIASGIDYASSVTPAGGRAFYPEGKLSYMFDPNKQMEDPGDFIVRSAAIPEAQ